MRSNQELNADVEITERQFRVLDTIICKQPDNHAETHRMHNKEFDRNELSYSQVRTTIENLKQKDLLVGDSYKIGNHPVEKPKGHKAWDSIVMHKMSSPEEKPVSKCQRSKSGEFKIKF